MNKQNTNFIAMLQVEVRAGDLPTGQMTLGADGR